MTIKEFIEAAQKGGYEFKKYTAIKIDDFASEGGRKKKMKIVEIPLDYGELFPNFFLLDPKAWEAVGKVKGWDHWGSLENPSIITYEIKFSELPMKEPDIVEMRTGVEEQINHQRNTNISAMKIKGLLKTALKNPWQYKFVSIFEALMEGKTIEEYIATLS